jgi:hypothetical protein
MITTRKLYSLTMTPWKIKTNPNPIFQGKCRRMTRSSPCKTPRLELPARASPTRDLDVLMSWDEEEPTSNLVPAEFEPRSRSVSSRSHVDPSTSTNPLWNLSTSTLPRHTIRQGPYTLGIIDALTARNFHAPSSIRLELMRIQVSDEIDENVQQFLQGVYATMCEHTKELESRLNNFREAQQAAGDGELGSLRSKSPIFSIKE